MDDNTGPHTANLVEDLLDNEGIYEREWLTKSPDLNLIEHVWDALGRPIARLQCPPNTHQMLKHALIEEWELFLQNEVNLICSMRVRCEACIVVRSGHIPH
ncbi:DDE_3 domain-containing protein [Trichonephila clavipes]|nr:DDE_3 domain-containing protein [Trichonephila clavipes]